MIVCVQYAQISKTGKLNYHTEDTSIHNGNPYTVLHKDGWGTLLETLQYIPICAWRLKTVYFQLAPTKK